ncbi:MAG: 2-amino-4-hydroxy-6-hydroxymethyldihydropteridine diphosphokinase [Candidatus Schekmanbacteria bacterium]|nr:2-amino-4-hydroxy-6-hydroxymethyldihydropteridine diphosphokinase [Candidatus Schekmanbacteria bacterium]
MCTGLFKTIDSLAESRSSHGATRVFLGLGGNVGDVRLAFAAVVHQARLDFAAVRLSPIFSTSPVGGPPQPAFLNAAMELRTYWPPVRVLAWCQRQERRLGRDRSSGVRNGPRPIDVDLLLYGELTMERPELEIPHPRMGDRAFVMLPLRALAPDLVIPRLGRVRDLAGRPFPGQQVRLLAAQELAHVSLED